MTIRYGYCCAFMERSKRERERERQSERELRDDEIFKFNLPDIVSVSSFAVMTFRNIDFESCIFSR